MGGFDEHAGIIGDWTPHGSSLPSFFPATVGDDNNTSGFTFSGPGRQIGSENGDGSQSFDSATKPGAFGEQKPSSRSGLVERMAARAGYNAPRLNTDMIRPSAEISQNQETRSPYLTIPPGLSPTSLLDSPVFLSNSLVQPSPTTGKFPFAPNKDNLFQDFNSSSFAFKPVPESAPISDGHVNPPFMSWQSFHGIEASGQSENHLPPQSIEEHHDEDAEQIISEGPSENGYNWRKYGQKQVKGSEYPRSYYKCTHLNCPVKKKVERSHEGHITEIIYKGTHNHSKHPPSGRPGIDGDHHDGNLEVASSTMVLQNGTQFESSDAVDRSLTFSNDDEEDDRATHGSVSLGYDGEGDEPESKRRKVEEYAADVSGATRAIREPRVVVQTTSEVDILDDGYRWRKYGQKVVKGNPNPRSYYKCTSTGCTVRKHVERASHDLKSVITTYEGKHNHDVPAARNSSHVNNSMTSHRPEPSQLQNSVARFERPHYGPSGYGYGMNLPGTGLAQMAMAGFGPNQGKMPVLPVHQYLGHDRQMNEMGMMLPKVEPVSDPGLNLANASSVYHHQMINRLPLGPPM